MALVCSGIVVELVPWGTTDLNLRQHRESAAALGAGADYLIVGDSKAGRFGPQCIQLGVPGKTAAVFSADSVTPVYHYNLLRGLRETNPEFSPKLIFVLIGANNMNANGLHALREYSLHNLLPLTDAWQLTGALGEYSLFAEVLFSRLLPVYGRRVPLTHLAVDRGQSHVCSNIRDAIAVGPVRPDAHPGRNDIADANYFDIYRRSLYNDYESSVMVVAALDKLLTYIKELGATPVLMMAPVTPEIRELEHELIGEAFDETIDEIVQRHRVKVLDLRDEQRYEFKDVNHLSARGAWDLVTERFPSIVDEVLGTEPKGGHGVGPMH